MSSVWKTLTAVKGSNVLEVIAERGSPGGAKNQAWEKAAAL